jgi:hypothetical protein
MYADEASLTEVFHKELSASSSPFCAESTAKEFYYSEGKTDFIAMDESGNLIAFEMKLTKWREALHQAHRNTSFAHYSYVVLPAAVARLAAAKLHEFHRRGVGLCSVDNEGIRIEIQARRAEPLRPWLTVFAQEYITKCELCPIPIDSRR